MLKQVSLFTENTEGGLFKITGILAKAQINISTMLANDSAEFGIVRLIVDQPELAAKVLREAGYQCREDNVIAVVMEDTPGYLDKILAAIHGANIDISYLYISFDRTNNKPVVIFKTSEPETATFLIGRGYNLVEN